MDEDDEKPIEELCKPLSAKVEPKQPSWGNAAFGAAGKTSIISAAEQQKGSAARAARKKKGG